MRKIARKSLKFAVITAYSAVSLLGQGLHSLSGHDGLHVGENVIECATHHAAHESADCEFLHSPVPDGIAFSGQRSVPGIRASRCIGQVHACQVCDLLAQARNAAQQAAAVLEQPHAVTHVSAIDQPLYAPQAFSPHAPRGPPAYHA